jgi:uncharacterized protein (DUF927 family)
VTQENNSDEWTNGSISTSKSNEKTTTTNKIELAVNTTTQPFCDPPIKADNIDAKHTFKKTEQEVVILPTDLNANARVSLKQLCNYYTRLSKKNLTSMYDDVRVHCIAKIN